MLDRAHLVELIELRHRLHQQPELSGKEEDTAAFIADYLKRHNPDLLLESLGKNGVAAVFAGYSPGETTMIRCELDALPIVEANSDLHYKSSTPGVSHKCGHDGHMAIVCGLARLLHENPSQSGRVILLFQPAEETGQGARWVLDDPRFKDIQPDHIFALHNLPGYPLHHVLLKKGTFCAASKGLKIKLSGITAHASEPENGVSPALAVAKLIPKLIDIPQNHSTEFSDFVLVTLTHTQIGEKTFGISPANAEIYLTIRAYSDQDLRRLVKLIEHNVTKAASNLKVEISGHEAFDATINHDAQVDLIEKAAIESGLIAISLPKPNRWSEDFGLFLQQSKGAMFGLGSGLEQPALHNPDYDFPDELIETGVKMFWGIIKELNY